MIYVIIFRILNLFGLVWVTSCILYHHSRPMGWHPFIPPPLSSFAPLLVWGFGLFFDLPFKRALLLGALLRLWGF
ncbi:hypothetical protein B0H11DRAFT_1983137, partial [Mycena galericulata]